VIETIILNYKKYFGVYNNKNVDEEE